MPQLSNTHTHELRLRQGALAGAAIAAVVAVLLASAHGRAAPPAAAFDEARYVLQDTWPLPEAPAEPIDLALGADGTLFVADGRSNQVLVYGDDDKLVDAWPDPPTGALPGYVHVPRAIAVDAGRELVYVVWARFRDAPPAFEPTGLFLDTRRPDGAVQRPLQAVTFLESADDIAVDAATGDIYFMGDGGVTHLRMPARVPIPGFALPSGAVRIAVSGGALLAVANASGRRLDLYTLDGAPAGRRALGDLTPLALAGDDSGDLRVLVRAASATDPAAPLVLTVDPSGAEVDALSAAAVGAPVPPDGAWPYALAVSGDQLALSTGSARFQVHRFEPGRARRPALIGGPVAVSYEPRGEDVAAIGAGLSLAIAESGDVVALDVKAAQLLRFDDSGDATLMRGVPDGAIDFALTDEGAAVVTTADGRLMRFPAGGAADGQPVWDVPCDCGLGGRVAVDEGLVHVTRTREQTVESFDLRDGRGDHWVSLPDAVGLWPSDVAVVRTGALSNTLLTGDLVTARVEGWSDRGVPDFTLQTGLLSGPRRMAVGQTADGTDVLAAVMGDGNIEMYARANGNLVARWLPRKHDGAALAPSDIALGRDGEVFVADSRARAVFVYGPGSGVPATPEDDPRPTATPSDLSCTIRGDKVAGPDTVVLGASAGVTLTLAAECPSSSKLIGADIVLVIDRSGSMQGAKMAAATLAAQSFAELLDVRHHRIGLASFSSDASIDVPLTDSIPAVIDGLAELRPDGGTNMAAALERARANLSEFGRPEALPVIVMLSDGQNNDQFPDPVPVADATRGWGAQIYTVGLGADVDADTLQQIAGGAGAYFFAPTPNELFPIYGQILRIVLSSLAGNLTIDDELGAGVEYVADSSAPPALVAGDRLRWGRSILPSSGLTLTYDVRPLAGGCTAVNQSAVADYTDADGERRSFEFPVPTVCAITATPTPTASPTLVATATPVPAPIHLPVLYRNGCLPGKAHADVVLLVDTSSSMAGDKLGMAQAAATLFVGMLDFPRDQVAVVGFSEEPEVAVGLTRDLPAAEAAIAGLRLRSGTRIDQALWEAGRLLRGAARDARNRAVVVLMTDGGHAGRRADALDVASEVRGMPATIYAIGLGGDADRELLTEVAGHPGRYYYAPTERDLAEIYRQIAVSIPCR
ncbi:MAG: VWA domain-containing protein [Anaerolineae bacterium]